MKLAICLGSWKKHALTLTTLGSKKALEWSCCNSLGLSPSKAIQIRSIFSTIPTLSNSIKECQLLATIITLNTTKVVITKSTRIINTKIHSNLLVTTITTHTKIAIISSRTRGILTGKTMFLNLNKNMTSTIPRKNSRLLFRICQTTRSNLIFMRKRTMLWKGIAKRFL